jgi:predicted Zn finger-like uncharacterized protein
MKLECTSCQTRYAVADAIIPPTGAKIRCRKCGATIVVPPRHEPAPTSMPVIPPSPEAPRPELITPPGHVTVTPPSTRSSSSPGTAFSFLGEPSPSPSPLSAPSIAPPPPPAAEATLPAHAAPALPAPTTPPASTIASLAAPAVGGDSGLPPGLSEADKAQHERARRLARVLASDMAIYNQEKKDRGLAEGNLVAVLGYEIKKSWEIYKERVGADFANSTPYFRNALNDLLAEGRKIF